MIDKNGIGVITGNSKLCKQQARKADCDDAASKNQCQVLPSMVSGWVRNISGDRLPL